MGPAFWGLKTVALLSGTTVWVWVWRQECHRVLEWSAVATPVGDQRSHGSCQLPPGGKAHNIGSWELQALAHWGWDKMTAIMSREILKCIFFDEKVWIAIEISLKFVPRGPIDNMLALIHIMTWPNRRQAIIWTNDGLVYWRICASLNELMLAISWFCQIFRHTNSTTRTNPYPNQHGICLWKVIADVHYTLLHRNDMPRPRPNARHLADILNARWFYFH